MLRLEAPAVPLERAGRLRLQLSLRAGRARRSARGAVVATSFLPAEAVPPIPPGVTVGGTTAGPTLAGDGSSDRSESAATASRKSSSLSWTVISPAETAGSASRSRRCQSRSQDLRGHLANQDVRHGPNSSIVHAITRRRAAGQRSVQSPRPAAPGRDWRPARRASRAPGTRWRTLPGDPRPDDHQPLRQRCRSESWRPVRMRPPSGTAPGSTRGRAPVVSRMTSASTSTTGPPSVGSASTRPGHAADPRR